MTNIKSGFLISIEGIDGSGKSTICKALKYFLTTQNYSVILTKEPGGTPLGENIRNFLQNRTFDICSKSEFLLFAADRAQHMIEVIEPALKAGQIVISDRMADSSLAYQGYGRGLDKDLINNVNLWALNNRVPDLTIYLKIDHMTALSRLQKRREGMTAIEQEKSEFFKRVIDGFDIILKERKAQREDSVIIADATARFEQVKNFIINQVDRILRK